MSLRRHQLARLSEAGWATVLQRSWDAPARECLAHWAAHRLPLVVTRQLANGAAGDSIALGLPAPSRWDRRRLSLQVPCAAVLCFDEFPPLAAIQPLLAPSARDAVHGLMRGLADCGATARVYGSYGWQALSGLDHVRPGSDLDLWVAVEDAVQADAAACALQAFAATHLRLDGELLFGDGAAVSWREWADWRAGRTSAILVKRLTGVALQREAGWCRRGPLALSV